jgi:hypothetical protein
LIQVRSTVTVQEPAAAMFIIIRISILRSEKSETHTQLYNDAIRLYTVMCIIKYYIRLYTFVREQCAAVLYLWDIFSYSPSYYTHHLIFQETFFFVPVVIPFHPQLKSWTIIISSRIILKKNVGLFYTPVSKN